MGQIAEAELLLFRDELSTKLLRTRETFAVARRESKSIIG